jgi:hypothetical protein
MLIIAKKRELSTEFFLGSLFAAVVTITVKVLYFLLSNLLETAGRPYRNFITAPVSGIFRNAGKYKKIADSQFFS